MWGLAIVGVLGMECLEVGLNTISKAAMRRGMNNFVYNAYSPSIGFLFLAPVTFIFHRMTSPPPRLTFSILCKLCVFGTIGYSVQMFMFFGIQFSSPAMASAMSNLTPAYTFILAIITRMEKLDFKSRSSQAKCIGTVVSILGATSVTFYEGPAILFSPKDSTPLHEPYIQSSQTNWVIGGLLLAAGSLSLAILFIVQTWILKEYPSELMLTLVSNGFSSVLAITVAVIVVRDPRVWTLSLDIELITILYSAIFMVVCRNIMGAWVVRRKGPVFVTMFKPLGMVIALVMGIAFLGDALYLGSVVGAIIIALGFYSVLWGKAEEEKAVEQDSRKLSFDSASDKLPLLQNKPMER
ncbi:hypothetical protein NMG60_11009000 [Bertholletia excelsa]